MNTFIQEIAEAYKSKSHIPALKRCIVTPNRRAGRFIKKTLFEYMPQGGFLPQIISIDDFIFQNIKLAKIDNADLLFNLYETVNEHFSSPVDFDDFNQYASTLLHDFNEIDMNMSDGEKVFAYLSDIKAIQLWNVDGSPLTESQKEYLEFYNQLSPVYQLFRENLFQKELCYQGMGYRHFAENLDSIIDALPWEHMLFAGFNALTNSEVIIFKKLKNNPLVDILWDVDSYYYNDSLNEAGLYLRRHAQWDDHISRQMQHHLKEMPKNIHIAGSPGNLGQTRMAAQILKNLRDENQSATLNPSDSYLNDTVIVPADEKLLLPLLNSLPASVLKNTNITMGFPIEHSQAYRLLESFIKMNIRAHKASAVHESQWRVHKTDLANVLDNELLQKNTSSHLRSFKHFALGFLDTKTLSEVLSQQGLQALIPIFRNLNNDSLTLNQALLTLCNFALEYQETSEQKIADQEADALLQMMKVLQRLNFLIGQYKQPQSFTSYYSLYKLLIRNVGQSFEGKFDEGLQIMGLLETRLMDFKNLIVISANEDVLPASSHPVTFIPWDIRREHHLPGTQERNAVFAYHFYRLLQRAENVWLIYSSSTRAMSSGEKSRFIKQIETELADVNQNITLKHHLLAFSETIPSETKEITIKKDAQIQAILLEMAQKGISPTQIINYVKCPLRFYLTWIARIKEPLEADDSIDDRILGNVVHKFLEDLYKPFIGQFLTEEPLKEALKTLSKTLPGYFIETGFKGQLNEGENYLNFKNTETYLRHFLKFEIEEVRKNSKIRIKALEERLSRDISIGHEPFTVKISGIADRIDEKDNVLRILDYKTGSVEIKKLSVTKKVKSEMTTTIFSDPEYDKALQLFLYEWMYQAGELIKVTPGIIALRSIKNPYLFLNEENCSSAEINEEFETLLNEIFNPEIDFVQTTDNKICRYCNFHDFCGKTTHDSGNN